jgi:hypothetical protein
VIKQELNRRPIYERRCDERLKGKTHIHWVPRGTGILKDRDEARLIDERFAIVISLLSTVG